MPTEEAMKSWGQNEVSYEPELWELEYVTYRYLSGLADHDLLHRYRTVVRSMPSYIAEKRAVIPINSYQSAWYWYRKEHQTRLEFALRNLEPPDVSIAPRQETFLPETQVVPDLAPVIPPLVSRVRSGFALFGLGDQQARERSHCGAQAIGPVGF